MNIELKSLGKRFHKTWIFKNLSHTFESNSVTGVIGTNGSGKSTLIKLLSAAELPTNGKISYTLKEKVLEHDKLFGSLSFAAPYIDLAEELSCIELIEFHLNFKSFQKNLLVNEFIELLYLTESKNKRIKDFSSGMKQRLKLGLAICSESNLLLLDEPCSNLDSFGIKTYHHLMDNFNTGRTIIIGSNEDRNELYKTKNTIRITDYK